MISHMGKISCHDITCGKISGNEVTHGEDLVMRSQVTKSPTMRTRVDEISHHEITCLGVLPIRSCMPCATVCVIQLGESTLWDITLQVAPWSLYVG